MSFPQTRRSLIVRINETASERDWQQFLDDYWLPVCRFALRRGSLSWQDSEDVASATFEALLTNDLLKRWQDQPTAKLRTLLCRVTINILSNRARVGQGRQRLLKELAQGGKLAGAIKVGPADDVSIDDADSFYAAWVTQLVQQTVDTLMLDLHRQGKGDYFRVLYSRLCEAMTSRQVSEALDIKLTAVENYFKSAKKRLAAGLEQRVRRHVDRYSEPHDAASEFQLEWAQLGDYLSQQGGLEQAVTRAYRENAQQTEGPLHSDSFLATRKRLSDENR